MIFEIATKNDIDDLCELLNTLFEQEVEFKENKQLQSNGLSMIIENEKIGHILVAKEDGKIIGMVNLLYSISTALGTKVLMLEDMVIKKKFQHKTIGTKLLTFAKKFAKEQGCKRITLLTDEDNIKAHSFYEKNGFRKSTMIPFRISL